MQLHWHKSAPIILGFLGSVFALGLDVAWAFPTQTGRTLGQQAISYRRQSNVWGRLDVGVVDAKTTTTPPDQAELDRRLEALVVVGGEGAIGKRWGLRLNVNAQIVRIRRAEEEPPRATTDVTIHTYTPSLDLTFVTDKGLEIFAGTQARIQPAYEVSRTFDNFESTEKFGTYQLRSNRVGVTRRSGMWAGGFFYVLGAEGQRTFEKSVPGASSNTGTANTGTETVFIPPKIGVFAQFGKGVVWDMEFHFIQGRGNGPRDEAGNTLYTDFFRARLGALFEVAGFGFKTGLSHQTLAYSDSAFITLDNIPWTSLSLLAMAGDETSHAFFGVILGYAEDGQSLPQFNAKRQAVAGSLSGGFFFPF